ncbi:unnamed protein product [Cylindrotheca closterium]|uniref:Uncharacterized protein n=1 Tax=Cylindrotheca closterium TaxID=2856 RepID=A0AAD2G234_9STRA|nr:unnamed protein product [Cylindrotheca closterium]
MSMGKGAVQVASKKQKLNTCSSTEAKLVGVDDVITMILWTKLFMEAQGNPIDKNILSQDNQSAIRPLQLTTDLQERHATIRPLQLTTDL